MGTECLEVDLAFSDLDQSFEGVAEVKGFLLLPLLPGR